MIEQHVSRQHSNKTVEPQNDVSVIIICLT
jgi:hypothetical protein